MNVSCFRTSRRGQPCYKGE